MAISTGAKKAAGASRVQRQFMFNAPLSDLEEMNIEVSALKPFDDSMSTAFVNFSNNESQTVKTFKGGKCVVLSVKFDSAPSRGPPRSDVLLKIENELDQSFADGCRCLNDIVEALGCESQLVGSTMMKPFSDSTQGADGLLFNCRFYESEGKNTYMLRNQNGKKIDWTQVVPGQHLEIVDFTVNSVRLNIDGDGNAYTRVGVNPKNIRILPTPGDEIKGKTGKRRASSQKLTVNELLKKHRAN